MKTIEIEDDVAEWLRSKSANNLIDLGELLKLTMLQEKGIENKYVLTTFGAIRLDIWRDFGPSEGIGGYNGLVSVTPQTYMWLQGMRKIEDEQLSEVLERLRTKG